MSNARYRRIDRFTLMEVMVAALILTMGTAMTFTIVGTARAHVLRAQQRWARSHVMSQAGEFFLLAGPHGVPPDGMLPEGFSANCDVRYSEELPDYAFDTLPDWPKWRLGVYTISVTNSYGDVVATWTVEKIVNEDDSF